MIIVLQIAVSLIGFLIIWSPVGKIIEKLTQKFRAEIDEKDLGHSLENAGEMIGKLERTFIYVLILIGQFQSIGFLIAAKSILRFSDHKNMTNPIKMSEYVIIGTLMSFLFAMLVGILCKFGIQQLTTLEF